MNRHRYFLTRLGIRQSRSDMTIDHTKKEEYTKLLHRGYRTYLLNKMYYGHKLNRVKNINLALEILIAVGASGSGIAGLTVWNTEGGKAAWAVISAISVSIAVIKPILKLSDTISRYGKLYGDYANIYFKVKSIEETVAANNDITQLDMDNYEEIRKRTAELQESDDPKPDKSLIIRLQKEINAQIPPQTLWMPSCP